MPKQPILPFPLSTFCKANMTAAKRTVLITGCSDGCLGAALAIAFHKAGLHVYATARNIAKMTQLSATGIQTLTLDVTSDKSIAECVAQIPSLDILVNNAGGGYSMPIADLSIFEAKKIFDLNVWSCLAVTQAFLPLLLESKGMIVNHTSVGSVCSIPFQAAYNASKAAMATFSETQRLELAPFGITVVDIKTGGAQSNFIENKHSETKQAILPKGSIYEPAREAVEEVLRGEEFKQRMQPAEQWAKDVARDLLRKKPPPVVWRGASAGTVRMLTLLPHGSMDGPMKKMTKLDIIEKAIRK